MLKEDQVRELLARCECIAGKELRKVRGNLKNSATRSPAIWELLVLEEFSHHFDVEFEPEIGSTPDIRAVGEEGAFVVEAAFIYPRYWENNQKERLAISWIYEEIKKHEILPEKITYQFFSDTRRAPHERRLPKGHEKSKVVRHKRIQEFISEIRQAPRIPRSIVLDPYHIRLTYNPRKTGEALSIRSVVDDQPRTIEEHAVYRSLRKKRSQHQVDEPYVVVLGTDSSDPVIHGVGLADTTDVIRAVLANSNRIGAVILISITCGGPGAPSVRIDVASSKIVSKRGRTGADSEVLRRTHTSGTGQALRTAQPSGSGSGR